MFSNKNIKMYLHYYSVNYKMTQILLNSSKSHIFKKQKKPHNLQGDSLYLECLHKS